MIVTATGLFTARVRSVGFASKVVEPSLPRESWCDAVTSIVVSAPWSVNSWQYVGPVSVPSGWRWQLPAKGQCSRAVSQVHRQVAVLDVGGGGRELDELAHRDRCGTAGR